MEEKKGNQKCIRYFWLFVFFLFVFGCQPKALQEERKGEKPQIIASVCGQSPKEFVNSFLTILAKSHPALSWVDPKTMTDMVFSIVKAQAPFTNEVSFDRPYWMGAFTAKCNDLGFFGVLPVKGSLGAKKIMDHFFVHEGRFSGIYRYRTKSQKKSGGFKRKDIFWSLPTVLFWIV